LFVHARFVVDLVAQQLVPDKHGSVKHQEKAGERCGVESSVA
jgi:hypothetical protein